MKLRQRMLTVFAVTMVVGVVALYFVSRVLLLSSFLQLEEAQMQQEVSYALAGLNGEYRSLGRTTNDYAYWDRTYSYMADPLHQDISGEFQDSELDGLALNLVVLVDVRGNIVFAKAYEGPQTRETRVPLEFLSKLFALPQMQPATVERAPRDGIVAFPDGPYMVATRPILTSQRSRTSRGELLVARKFSDDTMTRIMDVTRTSIEFRSVDSPVLPADYRQAMGRLNQGADDTVVRPLSEDRLAGYSMLQDVFDKPIFLLRVDTPRPIFERGKFSQRYLFITVLCVAFLGLLMIVLPLQRFVLSPLDRLVREVKSIGERKAAAERVQSHGRDEISQLGNAINGMLGALEKSQKDFLLITENIHQVFWIRDAPSGRYEYVSGAYEKIWGRSSEALVEGAESWKKAVYLEDIALVERALAEQVAGRSAEAHYRIVIADGSIRWLWERTFPVIDAQGKLRQVTGLTEDITEFKRTEQALLRSQTELEQRVDQRTGELAERGELVKLLGDSTPGAMYGMDGDGICTFCNPAGVRFLGYEDASEILGQAIHPLIHHTRPDGSPFPKSACPIFMSFQTGNDAHDVEDIFWRKDASSFPVEYSSRQIRRKGKVVGAVVTFTDITERKQGEMKLLQSQRLEAVGRLAAGIAHEINTPIQFVGDNTRFLIDSFKEQVELITRYEQLAQAAAQGPVQAALLGEIAKVREKADWNFLREEIPRAMDQMLEGLGRVSTIVRGMKEFSHVDRSNEKTPGDINRALESTLIVSRNELKYVADVETQFEQLPPVLCHLGDLNQVFLNLLVNAGHAIEDTMQGTTQRGKIEVRTRVDGDWVEIAISDSGTGIPEEVRDKIFDPFFTTKGVGKGTGQGLAIARAIVVDKHGGSLNFVTATGTGTTFFVRLPLSGTAVREEALT